MPDTPYSPMTDDDFVALTLAYLEDRCDEADAERLAEAMRGDESRCRLFNRVATQTWMMRHDAAGDAGADDIIEAEPIPVAKLAPADEPISLQRARGGRVRSRFYRYAAAAVLFLIATVAVSLWLGHRAGRAGGGMGVAQADAVATLIDAADAVWSTDKPAVGDAMANGDLALDGGYAQLLMKRGAVVSLHGPCRFALTGPNAGRLDAGRLEVYVPKEAVGYAVDLPDGVRVVDLGTRFRVDIDERGRQTVAVTEGRVRIERAVGSRQVVGSFDLVAGDRCVVNAESVGEPLEVRRAVTVVNPSFEDDDQDRTSRSWPTGWKSTIAGSRAGCELQGDRFRAGVDGRFAGYVNKPISSDPAGVVSALYQDLGVYTRAGETYRLTARVGARREYADNIERVAWGLALYDADSGQALASVQGDLSDVGAGIMTDRVLTFTCPPKDAGKRLQLRLVDPPGGFNQINFDLIRFERIVTPTPITSEE
ncbi:MAG: hypothetical protein GC159_01850 [Phycisphaera sp.]|nr:hypothetical protein [Phycisphaera sp.]